jgi:hypothetical protein
MDSRSRSGRGPDIGEAWRRRALLPAIACLFAVLPVGLCCFSADAQLLQAPVGHRQPTAADVANEKETAVSPEDPAVERALSNVCRGCLPVVPVGSVPRYDVALICGRSLAARLEDKCRHDELQARDKLAAQWTQFTTAARSNCIQAAEIGGPPSYVQLSICLEATQTVPNLSEGR